MNICVIIPAAGISHRFGESDKLQQDLGGRPLLVRTVEAFTKRDEVRSIVVAGPPDDFEAFRQRFGPTLSFYGVALVEGGRTARWETVQSALAAVPDDATHIAIHDAARPGVSNALLSRVFEAAMSVPAVIPGIPVAGTVKRVTEDAQDVAGDEAEGAILDSILGDAGKTTITARTVIETVARQGLIEVQTPQVFEVNLLRRAYAQSDLSGATDDAQVVERLGETVHVVEGDPSNIKVTTPADLPLIRAILGVKPPKDRPSHLRF